MIWPPRACDGEHQIWREELGVARESRRIIRAGRFDLAVKVAEVLMLAVDPYPYSPPQKHVFCKVMLLELVAT